MIKIHIRILQLQKKKLKRKLKKSKSADLNREIYSSKAPNFFKVARFLNNHGK